MVPPSVSAALAPAAEKGKLHHHCFIVTNTVNEKIMSQGCYHHQQTQWTQSAGQNGGHHRYDNLPPTG